MDITSIGGYAGAVVGILGGVAGTYFSIKNTTGSEERFFMIKASIACWIAVSLFLALLFTLPTSYRAYLWLPYSIMLSLGINAANRTQARIKKKQQESEQGADGTGEQAVR